MSMNWFYVLTLCCTSIVFASPVAKIEKLADHCHVLRNFERLLLKEGQGITSRDVLVVEKGVAKIALKGGSLWINASSKLRIKNDASGFWLELLEGEVYFEVEDDSTAWLLKTPHIQLRGKSVGFYLSLGLNDIELTVVEGELQWNGRWSDWSKSISNTQLVLESKSIHPVFERSLTALDREVYGTWLSRRKDQITDKSALSDLSGETYDPRHEMLTLEQGRRARLIEVNRVLDLRKSDVNTLNFLGHKESHRDLQEAIKEVESFSFPKPLAPPPK